MGIVSVFDWALQGIGNGVYLESVTDVDDERVGFGLDRDPSAIPANLQATHFALRENGEQIGVGVRAKAHGDRRKWARRVIVHAGNTIPRSAIERFRERINRQLQSLRAQLENLCR